MAVAISDLEYALGRDRNDALEALATANNTITRQNYDYQVAPAARGVERPCCRARKACRSDRSVAGQHTQTAKSPGWSSGLRRSRRCLQQVSAFSISAFGSSSAATRRFARTYAATASRS